MLQAVGCIKTYRKHSIEGSYGRGSLVRLMQAVVVKAYSLLKKLEPEGRSECTGTMVRHGCDPMTVASTMDSARLKESHEHGAHECTTPIVYSCDDNALTPSNAQRGV